MFRSICDFLVTQDPLASTDVIAVLGGPLERKSYGMELFQQDLAPRLVWSVARFDVRHTAKLLDEGPALIAMRDKLPPDQRHFWVDFEKGRGAAIMPANVKGTGTFRELEALASHLRDRAPSRIALVSTSIHLRRVRFCCSKIAFLEQRRVLLWAVPEAKSSFRRDGCWKRPADVRYLLSECFKLGRYRLLYP